jgi:hypothetical protein
MSLRSFYFSDLLELINNWKELQFRLYAITESKWTYKNNSPFFIKAATLGYRFKYGIAVVKDKPKSLNGYPLNGRTS